MPPRPIRILLALIVLSMFALAASAFSQPGGNARMKVLGTTISKPGQIEIEGDASHAYVILIAARLQDWTFKGTTINVPPDFLAITSGLPGFVGTLDGSGQAQASYIIPNNTAWDDLVLYGQTITLAASGHIAAVSEVSVLPLNLQGTFIATGSLLRDRALHTATPLDDGCRVLIIGGGSGNLSGAVSLSSMELYDFASQSYASAGSLRRARAIHTSTALDDGRVLVVGGIDTAWNVDATCEIVDPTSGFSSSFTGTMSRARTGHVAAKLTDGRVVALGGTNTFSSIGTLIQGITGQGEVFDKATGSWTSGPTLSEPRFAHTITRLTDGRFLVAGGMSWVSVAGVPIPVISNTADLLDPVTMSITAAGNLHTARLAHRTALMPDGRVLVVGGAGGDAYNPAAITDCEIFDPVANSFQVTGSLIGASAYAKPVEISGGRFLVAGGVQGAIFNPSAQPIAQVFDPVTGAWTQTIGALQTGRGFHTSVRLPDGSVLLTGGGDTSLNTTLASERYTE
ncbi:MAG: hypothetical protein RL885_17410 [Planctomycetota bacterium]